jgi:hypothetical protein
MDGTAFLEAYRQELAARGVAPAPVVCFTAGGHGEAWAAQHRAAAVLPKPFGLDDLRRLLVTLAAAGGRGLTSARPPPPTPQ